MRILLPFVALCSHLVAHAQFGEALPIHDLQNGPAMEARDVDADGDLDLIAILDGTLVVAWTNLDGAGTFSEGDTLLTLAEEPTRFVFDDLNADDAVDLIFVNASSTALELAWNSGSGALSAPVLVGELGSIPGALSTGDITGNGWREPVVTFAENGQAGIAYWPNSQGALAAEVRVPDLFSGDAPAVLAIGNLDGNLGQDIFVVASDLAALGLMNGNSDGSTWDVITLFFNFDYPLLKPQIIDVDGDGDLDIAEANQLAVQWVENRLDTPQGNFSIQVLAPFTTAGPGQFGSLGCNSSAGVVYIPSNPVLPVRWSHHLPSIEGFAPKKTLGDVPRGQHPRLADMNGDGRMDLILVRPDGAFWFPNTLLPATTEVQVPQFDTLCIQGPPLDLPEALPSNGQWSGTWVQNGVLFRSNAPSTASVPLDYTFYEPEGCPVGERARIQLVSGPALTSTLGPVLCSAQRPIALQTQPANVEWSGIPESGILDPTTFNGGVIVCAYTDPTSSTCVSFFGPIAVWPSVQASIQAAGPFCITSGLQEIVPLVNLPGTTWSGDIISSTNASALFDPAQGAGEYTVILARVPSIPQQCANSDTLLITVVDDLPEVSVSPLPVYCASGGEVVLSGAIPTGGDWSGPGVSNGALDASLVGAGSQPVFYSFTNAAGCTGTAVLFVQLANNAVVQNTERTFCSEDPAVQFIATPAGGTWAAPLSPSGTFSPALAGVGSFALSYTYTDPNGCALSTAPEQLVVAAPTAVEIDALPAYCLNDEATLLTGSLPGVWSGAVSGFGSSVLFDPAALGIGTWNVSLTVNPNQGCNGDTTISIIVDACSGIYTAETSSFATAAPNPFADRFQLIVDHSGTFTMDIVDALGRSVQSGSFSTFGKAWITVDLSAQASGNYTLLLRNGSTAQAIRVVKTGH